MSILLKTVGIFPSFYPTCQRHGTLSKSSSSLNTPFLNYICSTVGCVSSTRISDLPSFTRVLKVTLLQGKVPGCLFLPLCVLSQSSFMYLHVFNYHSYQSTPNFKPHFSELEPLDQSDTSTWMSKRCLRFTMFKPKALSPQTQYLLSVSFLSKLSLYPPYHLSPSCHYSRPTPVVSKWAYASQWVCKTVHWNTARK